MIVTEAQGKPRPVSLRIPDWASQATVDGLPAANGTVYHTPNGAKASGSTTFKVDFNPEIRVETGFNGAVSVHRGALMFSLPITANYTQYGHHFGGVDQSNDYSLTPTMDWAYALDLTAPMKFVQQSGYVDGSAPWNHTGWPVMIAVKLRPVTKDWVLDTNSAAALPEGPVCAGAMGTKVAWECGQPKSIYLVPHGGTDLRIGEFPLSGF